MPKTRASSKRRDSTKISTRPSKTEGMGDASSEITRLQRELDKVQSKMNKKLETVKTQNAAEKLRADKIQHNLTHALQENTELRTGATASESRVILDCSQLEDIINCGICGLKMWTPHIIPKCGHVFCKACLHDWFSTLLAQHQKTVPEFSLNQSIPGHVRDLLVRVRDRPELQTELDLEVAQYRFSQSIPQPVYTCPTCRDVVRNKPVEIFALKSVVETISNAMGKTSPKATSMKGKKPASAGPWDEIFPVDIV